jgi:hypothetical protein
MSILAGLLWNINDGEPDTLVNEDGETFTGESLVNYLNTPVVSTEHGDRWIPDADGYINLHFPVRITSYDVRDPEAPEILAYPFNDLRTIGQLLGAIHTYFSMPLTVEQLRNALGLTSGSYPDIIGYLNHKKRWTQPFLIDQPVTVAMLMDNSDAFEEMEPLHQPGHYQVIVVSIDIGLPPSED